MDTRRLLILTVGLSLGGCATLGGAVVPRPTDDTVATPVAVPVVVDSTPAAPRPAVSPTERPYLNAEVSNEDPVRPEPRPTATAAVLPDVVGRPAITAANAQARAASRADGFVGGVQVFAWQPGRVFEIWTAPLRVTTLSLGPGEIVVAKAAGDTLRWQIGETTSGTGTAQRAHVLVKPLERGLETNLVLTTSHRVYLIELKSGASGGFNAAVTWDVAADEAIEAVASDIRIPDPVATPSGPLDARYRIESRGRRPRWAPTSVFNDGTHTFIAFTADLEVDEAPVLFVITPAGEVQMVNYRQAGNLFIVDRVFDQAELRLGDRRPQIVRITRLAGGRS